MGASSINNWGRTVIFKTYVYLTAIGFGGTMQSLNKYVLADMSSSPKLVRVSEIKLTLGSKGVYQKIKHRVEDLFYLSSVSLKRESKSSSTLVYLLEQFAFKGSATLHWANIRLRI